MMQHLARAALLALCLAAAGCAQQAAPGSNQSTPATAQAAPAPTAQDCARVREMWRQAGMQPQHMADCQ